MASRCHYRHGADNYRIKHYWLFFYMSTQLSNPSGLDFFVKKTPPMNEGDLDVVTCFYLVESMPIVLVKMLLRTTKYNKAI